MPESSTPRPAGPAPTCPTLHDSFVHPGLLTWGGSPHALRCWEGSVLICLMVWGLLCCGSIWFSAFVSHQLHPDEDFLHPCIFRGSCDPPPPATGAKCSSFSGVRGGWQPVLCFLLSHEIAVPYTRLRGVPALPTTSPPTGAFSAPRNPTTTTTTMGSATPASLAPQAASPLPSRPLSRVFGWPEEPELLVNTCPPGRPPGRKE